MVGQRARQGQESAIMRVLDHSRSEGARLRALITKNKFIRGASNSFANKWTLTGH